MDHSVEYRLGQLDAGLKALIFEFRGMRAEMRETMAQHDARDDERFTSHATRLLAIEKKLDVDDAAEAAIADLAGDQQRNHHARLSLVAPMIGAVIGAIATAVTGLVLYLGFGVRL
jgi:hypothetical protein